MSCIVNRFAVVDYSSAVVAGLAFGRIGQMDIHLCAQYARGQGLLQLRGQRLEIQCAARSSLRNQLIQ